MEYLMWSAMVYGATVIIVYGKIFSPPKEFLIRLYDGTYTTPKFISKPALLLAQLLTCPMCSSFWIGLTIGSVFGHSVSGNPILDGFLGTGVTQLIMNLTHKSQPQNPQPYAGSSGQTPQIPVSNGQIVVQQG